MGENCPNTRIQYKEVKPECKLLPSSKYSEEDYKKEGPNDSQPNRCKDHKTSEPIPCPECKAWQKYVIYAIPLLLYIPWAINKMRCKPKCCPQPSCCPKVSCPAQQNTCCEPMPTKWKGSYQPKQQEDFKCGKEKKACQD